MSYVTLPSFATIWPAVVVASANLAYLLAGTAIAATGGVGRELLEQAVAAGHDVTAVVRNPGKLSREVRAVTSDLTAPDPAVLEEWVGEQRRC
jgi:hypothetical protein